MIDEVAGLIGPVAESWKTMNLAGSQ
jgi:hypothetical protein